MALQFYLTVGAVGLATLALVAAVAAWLTARQARGLVRKLSPDTERLLTAWRELEPAEAAGQLAAYLETVGQRLREADRRLADLDHRQQRALSRRALVRFDNDTEVSGKLSFALALLDEKGHGFVLTSLYNLQGNRLFLRPVRGGQVERELLPEEAQALQKALQGEE